MQRLSLCIDIDGTVTDPYYWIPRANKFFKRNVKPEDVTCYDMHEVLGVEEKEYEEFYSLFGTTLHKEAEIRDGVHEAINEFYKTHYIHFVTAREEKMEWVSLDWLYEHQIPFDSISLLGSHDKVQRAGELESDFFIEDKYDNALQLARAGFDVLLIDCSYNQGPLLPKITRVRKPERNQTNHNSTRKRGGILMNFLTHIMFSKTLYRHLSKQMDLDQKAFFYGNIKPDLSPQCFRNPHILENYLFPVYYDSNRLIRQNPPVKEFSVELGVICHHLCDFFCYCHLNQTIYHKLFYHLFYEIRLHFVFCSMVLKNKINLESGRKNPEENIASMVMKMRKDYMSKQKILCRDIEYALQTSLFACELIDRLSKDSKGAAA